MSTPFRASRAYRATQTDYFSLLAEVDTHSTLTTREVSAVSPVSPNGNRERAESAISAESPQDLRERIGAALLDDFARHGDVHEVRVPGVDETLFIVPTIDDVDRLAGERITRGRIWTAHELADLLRSSATAQDFAAVALAKIVLDGDVVAVRRRAEGGL